MDIGERNSNVRLSISHGYTPVSRHPKAMKQCPKYRPFTDEEKKQMHSKYRKNGKLNRDYRKAKENQPPEMR